ncbi:C1 family peptidase [Phenylobacterium sp.]|uniref:C1 family peptidase n=1 Tax=Phenylobacterium sp. TaxID=1871053 RepID=UPI0012265ADE|nr:C1 family peptidase [Phenylobacterium sp.]THD61610.1 MAG: peptidase C1 [Phenylobacterium sp.]
MPLDIAQDLRSRFGTARDQGERPTCMAFAASDAHAAARGGWAELSCEFAFYHAQRRAGRSPRLGASLRSMLDALKLDGQPLEGAWPYLETLPSDLTGYAPPSTCEVFRRDGEAHAHELTAVIENLDQGVPSMIILELSDAFYTPDAQGVVRPRAGDPPDPQRRHAVIAVGHGLLDGVRLVLIRNSWGTSWGLSGHAWLTEDFLTPRIIHAARLTETTDVPRSHIAA